ncbi:MAG: 30S ribosomal protein S9 [Candidatus Shapirobacteria bacterium]|jgi:small subunit ribosomal protein S9|nr:30S ribosomal protein S9 [Candidatus Shapirobacteria bacterium]
MVKKIISNTYTYAIGRRKAAIATVKLFFGKGESTVNKIPADKYFPGKTAQIAYNRPFVITETFGKYYYQTKIIGGGKGGQVEALQLALARALVKIDENFKPVLKPSGLLTVDSRVKERRMVGTGGKSRRQKQSPKR